MKPLCLPYFAETLTRKMHPEFDIINLRSKKNKLHKLKSDYGRIIDSLKEYIDKYSLGITKIKDTFVTDRNNEKQ